MADLPDYFETFDFEDEEPGDGLATDCGMQPDGTCIYAGTEFCDWGCDLS